MHTGPSPAAAAVAAPSPPRLSRVRSLTSRRPGFRLSASFAPRSSMDSRPPQKPFELRLNTSNISTASLPNPSAPVRMLWQEGFTPKEMARISLSDQGIKRQEVIFEIIQTEADYVKDLVVIVDTFMRPLRELRVIPAGDIDLVFNNIPEILQLHQRINRAMLERQKVQYPVIKDISDVLMPWVDSLRVYTKYICNQDRALRRVEALKKSSERFLVFYKERLERPECRGMPIDTFLLMPFQRLLKYPLLIRTLLKFTPPDTPEHKLGTALLDHLEARIQRIQNAKALTDNIEQLDKLAAQIHGLDGFVVAEQDRKLVKAGPVRTCILQSDASFTKASCNRVYMPDRDGEQPIHLFLFNNVLLVTQTTRPNIRDKIRLNPARRAPGVANPLLSCTSCADRGTVDARVAAGLSRQYQIVCSPVRVSAIEDFGGFDPLNTLKLRLEPHGLFRDSDPTAVVLHFDSDQEKREWVDAFQKHVDAIMSTSKGAQQRFVSTRSKSPDKPSSQRVPTVLAGGALRSQPSVLDIRKIYRPTPDQREAGKLRRGWQFVRAQAERYSANQLKKKLRKYGNGSDGFRTPEPAVTFAPNGGAQMMPPRPSTTDPTPAPQRAKKWHIRHQNPALPDMPDVPVDKDENGDTANSPPSLPAADADTPIGAAIARQPPAIAAHPQLHGHARNASWISSTLLAGGVTAGDYNGGHGRLYRHSVASTSSDGGSGGGVGVGGGGDDSLGSEPESSASSLLFLTRSSRSSNIGTYGHRRLTSYLYSSSLTSVDSEASVDLKDMTLSTIDSLRSSGTEGSRQGTVSVRRSNAMAGRRRTTDVAKLVTSYNDYSWRKVSLQDVSATLRHEEGSAMLLMPDGEDLGGDGNLYTRPLCPQSGVHQTTAKRLPMQFGHTRYEQQLPSSPASSTPPGVHHHSPVPVFEAVPHGHHQGVAHAIEINFERPSNINDGDGTRFDTQMPQGARKYLSLAEATVAGNDGGGWQRQSSDHHHHGQYLSAPPAKHALGGHGSGSSKSQSPILRASLAMPQSASVLSPQPTAPLQSSNPGQQQQDRHRHHSSVVGAAGQYSRHLQHGNRARTPSTPHLSDNTLVDTSPSCSQGSTSTQTASPRQYQQQLQPSPAIAAAGIRLCYVEPDYQASRANNMAGRPSYLSTHRAVKMATAEKQQCYASPQQI